MSTATIAALVINTVSLCVIAYWLGMRRAGDSWAASADSEIGQHHKGSVYDVTRRPSLKSRADPDE